jgi:hypothetical protein
MGTKSLSSVLLARCNGKSPYHLVQYQTNEEQLDLWDEVLY